MIRPLPILLALAGAAAAAAEPHQPESPSAAPPPAATPTAAVISEAVAGVVAGTSPTVVRIFFGEDDMITGVLISRDGLVATCAHLPVEVGGAVKVGTADGRTTAARVLSRLPAKGESNLGKDLALVRMDDHGPWPAATLSASSPKDPEALLIALGFPDTMLLGGERAGCPLYARIGHPIAGPYVSNPGQLITSIAGTGGDSGGPLFDGHARLVGITHSGDASGAHVEYTRVEVLLSNWGALARDFPDPVTESSPTAHRWRTGQMTAAMTDACRNARASVVEVCVGSRWAGLGCVVGEGLVLTKASELLGPITIRTTDRFTAIAEVAATDPDRDLALLRLPYAPELLRGVPPVPFDDPAPLATGTPLVLATPPDFTPIAGVACFPARAVPKVDGAIPCEFEPVPGGLRVARVVEEMRKFRLRPPTLPLRAGDILTAIEDCPVPDLAAYARLIESPAVGAHPTVAGEPVRIAYRRGDAAAEATLSLEFARTPSGQLVRPSSLRYSGFAKALATDLPIRPEHCGGPVVDARGRTAGVLIARAPFIEALVLPAEEVAASLQNLRARAAEPAREGR